MAAVLDSASDRDSDRGTWKTAPHRGAGSAFVPERPLGGAPHFAQMPTGLPREARCGLLFRLRGRPPACHRRGRSPLNQPTRDHADGATLGRWDAKASQRPRRPGTRDASGAAAGCSDSDRHRDQRRPGHEETVPHRGAGFDIVPERPSGPASRIAQCHTGLPRGARCGLLIRLRGRPPACHRRGRSPLNQPTRDHADGATLGRWDARASQRPRRPGMRTMTVAAPQSEALHHEV